MSETLKLTNGYISASIENVEEGRIVIPTSYAKNVQTLSGEFLLWENGERRATMGFLSTRADHDDLQFYYEDEPVIFVMNGGPLAPATTDNALTLTGPYYIVHGSDGHLYGLRTHPKSLKTFSRVTQQTPA